jgi:hypothetical protein
MSSQVGTSFAVFLFSSAHCCFAASISRKWPIHTLDADGGGLLDFDGGGGRTNQHGPITKMTTATIDATTLIIVFFDMCI